MLRCLGLPSAATLTKARREKCIVVLLIGYATGSCEKNMVSQSLVLPAACGSRSFLKAEAAPAESDCVAREGIFARRAKTNLPMCLRRCESSSLGRFAERVGSWLHLAAAEVPCKTAPFASFSGRAEKGGPARPERGPIYEIVFVYFDATICLFRQSDSLKRRGNQAITFYSISSFGRYTH